MFGEARTARTTRLPALEEQLKALDQQGYAVIPPSGKLRDLTACVPHILETLGCRILHLLPIGPTPTTYARMGRFGSPYAQLDLTGIDPALVEFDQRTTAVDQFRELAYAVHLRGGLVFLDIVVNHTGWGSRLQEERPEWFKRNPDGTFHSPGAWGVTWGDLVELDNSHPELWETTADALLTWCRRGVDGFRCDAGYMVPVPAWQYIVARVRQEFPDCVFLLEGLGGAWEATETPAHRGRHAVGLLGAVPELLAPAGRPLPRPLPPPGRADGALGPLQRDPRQRPAGQARRRLVAAAQPPVRPGQPVRRLRLHRRAWSGWPRRRSRCTRPGAWPGAPNPTWCPSWRVSTAC